jgi:hypothetical protein
MSFPYNPPNNVPMVDLKTGLVTVPWAEFFTKLAAKLNATELNLSVTPNLVWTDKNGNPHTIANQT